MVEWPSECAVEAREASLGSGFGLFAPRNIAEGEVLLSIPLSRCTTASDLPADHAVAYGLPDADLFGRALVAVVLDSPERAAYLSAVVQSPLWLTMAGWPPDSEPARAVRGCVGWDRAQAQRALAEKEAASLGSAGLLGCSGFGALEYLRAQLLVQVIATENPLRDLVYTCTSNGRLNPLLSQLSTCRLSPSSGRDAYRVRSLDLACTRYCHHQCCMVYGIQKGGRMGARAQKLCNSIAPGWGNAGGRGGGRKDG